MQEQRALTVVILYDLNVTVLMSVFILVALLELPSESDVLSLPVE